MTVAVIEERVPMPKPCARRSSGPLDVRAVRSSSWSVATTERKTTPTAL